MKQDFQLIAERAYFLAEAQGFALGRELDFWLQAEDEMSVAPLAATAEAPAKPKRAPRKTAVAKVTTDEVPATPKPRARRTKAAV